MGKFLSLLAGLVVFGALSSSSHYQLQSFSVNSGATSSSADSSSHKLFGSVGEQSGPVSGDTSSHYTTSGLAYNIGVDVPNPPTLSNGSGTYYNKLKFTIDNSREPSDVTYAVGVNTTNNPNIFSFVQADGTLNSSRYYQNYTGWGGSSGSFVINLSPNTTYYFSVYVKQSTFGAPLSNSTLASIATVNPSLSFSLSPNNLNLGNLNAGSIVTSSTITTTFSTNAYNGGYIYLTGSNTGLVSAYSGHTIQVSPPNGDLTSLSEGFGAQSQSANGGVSAQSPYTGTLNTVGTIYTSFVPIYAASAPVSSSTETLNLQAKAANTTPAASDYTVTLTFVAAASY